MSTGTRTERSRASSGGPRRPSAWAVLAPAALLGIAIGLWQVGALSLLADDPAAVGVAEDAGAAAAAGRGSMRDRPAEGADGAGVGDRTNGVAAPVLIDRATGDKEADGSTAGPARDTDIEAEAEALQRAKDVEIAEGA